MTVSADTFSYISELVRRESAIRLAPGKEYLVESRLLPLARKQGMQGDHAVDQFVRKLKAVLPPGASIGEAVPAPLEKSHGSWRFQTSLRGPAVRPLARAVQQVLGALPLPEDVFVAVDVDPVQLT